LSNTFSEESQLPVRDQFDAVAFQCAAGGFGGEDFQFGGAGFAQASFDSAKIVIAVARVADELPGAVGNGSCNGFEQALIECAGDEDAEGAVGRAHAGLSNRLVKAA